MRSSAVIAGFTVTVFTGLVGFIAYENLVNKHPLTELNWLTAPLGVAIGLLAKKYLAPVEEKQIEKAPERIVILMIDDTELHHKLIKHQIWNAKYPADVFSANSVEQALDMLTQKDAFAWYPKPDLILLDMVFETGKLQGVDFLAKKIDDPSIYSIPVIAISAHDKTEFVEFLHLIDLCYDYVKKGVIATLLASIEKCTGVQAPKEEEDE